MNKTCFRCGVLKPISDFYKHSMMADGHLNKCKTCTKSDSMVRRESKIHDPDWLDAERERCRIKSEKARKNKTAKKTSNEAKKRWAIANKHKVKAEVLALKALRAGSLKASDLCEVCETKPPAEMHHHDYTRPLLVVWVCVQCHKFLHRKQKGTPIKRRSTKQ